MAFLIDTNIFIWAESEWSSLPLDIQDLLVDPSRRVCMSTVSVWEIGIKMAVGKLQLPTEIERAITESRLEMIPVSVEHAIAAGRLPLHHHDPFDRMLVAQAMVEKLTFLTTDRALLGYGAFVRLV